MRATRRFETRTNILNQKENKKISLKNAIKPTKTNYPLSWLYSLILLIFSYFLLSKLCSAESLGHTNPWKFLPTSKRREIKYHLDFPWDKEMFSQDEAFKDEGYMQKFCLCVFPRGTATATGFPHFTHCHVK